MDLSPECQLSNVITVSVEVLNEPTPHIIQLDNLNEQKFLHRKSLNDETSFSHNQINQNESENTALKVKKTTETIASHANKKKTDKNKSVLQDRMLADIDSILPAKIITAEKQPHLIKFGRALDNDNETISKDKKSTLKLLRNNIIVHFMYATLTYMNAEGCDYWTIVYYLYVMMLFCARFRSPQWTFEKSNTLFFSASAFNTAIIILLIYNYVDYFITGIIYKIALTFVVTASTVFIILIYKLWAYCYDFKDLSSYQQILKDNDIILIFLVICFIILRTIFIIFKGTELILVLCYSVMFLIMFFDTFFIIITFIKCAQRTNECVVTSITAILSILLVIYMSTKSFYYANSLISKI